MNNKKEIENINYVICPICQKEMKQITSSHVKLHNLKIEQLKNQYPNQKMVCRNTFDKLSNVHKGKKRIFSEEWKLNISKGHIGQFSNKKGKTFKEIYGEYKAQQIKQKISKKLINRELPSEHCENISKGATLQGYICKFGEELGTIKYYEKIRKLRVARINQIEKNCGQYFPNYNKIASEIFKKFDELNNTKGRYAVYGNGEYKIPKMYYSLDYINFDLKLIIEVDELYHFEKTGKLREYDIRRQKEIQELFQDFKFLRFKEEEMHKILEIKLEKIT